MPVGKGRTRNSSLVVVLVLLVSLIFIPAVGAIGKKIQPRSRYGIGVNWFIYYRHIHRSFVGATGKMELTTTGTVTALFELGLAKEPDGDDNVLLMEGSMVVYSKVGEGKIYFGLGLGLARWKDPIGWDKGSWYQQYRKFFLGGEFPVFNLTLFVEKSFTFGSVFNPVLSAGAWF